MNHTRLRSDCGFTKRFIELNRTQITRPRQATREADEAMRRTREEQLT